jgi:type IV pilus assembly protein PilY1
MSTATHSQPAPRTLGKLELLLTLGWCIVSGVSLHAHAACTPTATVACIANQPIQSTSVVKPNIMYILDNSGSMGWDYMPDAMGSVTDATRRNFQVNSVYYNPNFDYTANLPKRPDPGTGAIVTMPSQVFTGARDDPFSTSNTNVTNLGTSFVSYSGDAARPAFYCKFIGGNTTGTSPCNTKGYQLVNVNTTSCVVSGDVTQCPAGADERVNFANWYSYFRTRIAMVRTGLASSFAPLDNKFRVGFYTINNPTDATFTNGAAQNIADFAGGQTNTQKGDWYARLFKVGASGSTPLQTALDRIGKYYSGNAPPGLNGDPIDYSCQRNFTIFSTDGYWNLPTPPRWANNPDQKVPNPMPIKSGNATYNPADTGLTEGANFPLPFYDASAYPVDNNGAAAVSLADVAMYYWITDLRTSGPKSANNVPAPQYNANNPTADTAYWQHMTTFTIGLGVNGTLAYPGGLPTAASGTSWPLPVSNGQTTIDDLWHAAVNGHGQYYKVTDPASLTNGLNSALKAITDTMAYGVGPAASTTDFKSPDQNDYTTYVSSYRVANWSGDVKKYNIDRSTGLKTGADIWSAAYQLDQKVNPGLTTPVNATQYANRNIVTRTETGVAVPFDYASLSATQRIALCYKAAPGTGPCITTPGDRESLINYLRGDPTYEGDYGIAGKRFRNRFDLANSSLNVAPPVYRRSLLGTIVNAQPAYVAAEQRIYQDSYDPGYSGFKAAQKGRTPTLYVPANDGMVHAFDAASGAENWAYIPGLIIPTALDENGYEKGLRALSYQDGGAPAYNHHFYIDATPEAGSIDITRTQGSNPATSSSGNWRTILVGGLGKGGKGYYALDVTTPAGTLAGGQAAVRWEFPSAADPSHAAVISGGLMGYSFGRAIIAKTKAWGWVAMVPSGYNNTDPLGLGYVFVLDAWTGKLLETLQTTGPAPGLAYITTLVKSNNKVATQVYGGDLNGAVWRFDFGSPALVPRVSQIFSSSTSTPITSEVNVSVDTNNGDRWVFFGTGQYLDVADRSTAIPDQYLVGLRDGTLTSPRMGAAQSLNGLTNVVNLLTGVANAPNGWKYKLPTAGERVVMKPIADLRTVVFASLIPTTDPCSPGTSGSAYGLEYDTGKSRLIVNGSVIPSYFSSTGISGLAIQTTGKTATSSGSPQVVIYTPDGQPVRIGLDMSRINSGTRHVGWRELLNEY